MNGMQSGLTHNRLQSENSKYRGSVVDSQKPGGTSGAENEIENRFETASAGKNSYALVAKRPDEDLLNKTYQSFMLQQEGMTQEEADEFQKMQSQQRETQYMATNPQLIMKKGKFDDTTPEYAQFKRQNITKWGVVSQLMQQIEKFLSQYNVNYVYIDVMRLLQLSDLDNDKYEVEDILSCCSNRVQVEEAVKNPRNKYKGPNGPVLAAIKVQTVWRRHKAYSAFSQLKFLMIKATIIQRKFRLY